MKGEIKMIKPALSFCLIIFLTSSLLSQKIDGNISMKADTGYINVDGGKLFYEIAGQGDYIVLLHDGILHHVIWNEQFPVLAKNYRVVRYDRRGFGKSSAPQAPFSHRDDLNQLFTQLLTSAINSFQYGI
jgi:alpha-beta hydrolase superfamily lysophospholipase